MTPTDYAALLIESLWSENRKATAREVIRVLPTDLLQAIVDQRRGEAACLT